MIPFSYIICHVVVLNNPDSEWSEDRTYSISMLCENPVLYTKLILVYL